MKLLTFKNYSQVRSCFLFLSYLAVSIFLIISIQNFIYEKWGVLLSDYIVNLISPIPDYLYELCGWTLIGFVPMGGLLVWLTLKKLFCKSGNRDSAYCRWINELAVGLGLLGTIRGFILVASEQSASINNGPDETLSAILIGMGSTFVGIILAIWALLLQTPEDS